MKVQDGDIFEYKGKKFIAIGGLPDDTIYAIKDKDLAEAIEEQAILKQLTKGGGRGRR